MCRVGEGFGCQGYAVGELQDIVDGDARVDRALSMGASEELLCGFPDHGVGRELWIGFVPC